jgi:hypothetical protein
VWAIVFSIFFFFFFLNCSCLIKFGPFKLLIFLWLGALNFDDFFLGLIKKKKLGLKFFFFFFFFFFFALLKIFFLGLNMPGALGERLARLGV